MASSFPSRLAALLLLLPFAACDSGTDDMAFVGAWDLAEVRTETVIQSRSDQTLLVLTGESTGSVSVTGDQTHTLTRARYNAEPSVGQSLSLEPEMRPPSAFRFTTLGLSRSTNDNGVSRSDAYFEGIVADGSRTRTYRASLPADRAPFVRDGARLSVPTITLSDGEGRTVTVGGALTFPTIMARAGQDVTVPGARSDESATGSITFRPDFGVERRFTSSAEVTIEEGIWELVEPGRVSVDFGRSTPTVYDVDTRGGGLRLSTSVEVSASCGDSGECLPFVEDEIFADRGSLSSARRVTVAVYR